MTSLHLETQKEPEVETPTHILGPANSVETVKSPVPEPDVQAEILWAIQQIQKKSSTGRLTMWVRTLFRHEERNAIDLSLLLQMDAEDVLGILRKESRKRSQSKRLNVVIGAIVAVRIILLCSHAIVGQGISHETLDRLPTYIAVLLVLLIRGAAASRKHQAAAAAISRFDDVRVVGPLAEVLKFPDRHVVPIAVRALIRLLPRLQASDASLLNPAQRACLNRALWGTDTALTLAILKAWEQVGDTGAISEVEKLVEWRGRGEQLRRPAVPESELPRVIVAAQECLSALQQGVERQRICSQLLRPADGNPAPSAMLLRPAVPRASTEPSGQLLRPTAEN